jgi:hypothetical protein
MCQKKPFTKVGHFKKNWGNRSWKTPRASVIWEFVFAIFKFFADLG